MSISKALVELHGGKIIARSEGKDRGTSFAVELPATDGVIGEQKPAHKTRPLRILVVEDNHDTAAMMERLLREFGHEASTAGSIKEAIEAAKRGPFDLLISDIGLPDGSGWELMRRLREQHREVKGIALSGFGSEEDARQSREAGFIEHMTKPISIHKLEQVLQAVGG